MSLGATNPIPNFATTNESILDYFIDQFSNLHAMCDEIRQNDDDCESLQYLLDFINEDYFLITEEFGKHVYYIREDKQSRNRHQQLMIFARRLYELVERKLKIFEEYA